MKVKMKKILRTILAACIACTAVSCEDIFLQKPDVSGTVDLDRVFSSTKNAEAVLFRCYRDVLVHGWPGGLGWSHGTLGSICGELSKGYSWHATWTICDAGLTPTPAKNASAGTAGADDWGQNWECIRECFIVKENIDRVPDMSDEMKGYIKAEATALIAYRYMGMFYRYGGVPIITKSFESSDPDLAVTRATLQKTLEYTLGLIDEACNGLPDSWAGIGGAGVYTGRITKGAVLAMKARLLMFAARPLFNSEEPYLSFNDASYNDRICFGNYDRERWYDAIEANEDVLEWATANGYELINTGGAGAGQPNPNALDDYGTATSVLNNREVLLAYKLDETGQISLYYNPSGFYGDFMGDHSDSGTRGMLTNQLEKYYDKDGNDIDWPKIGESAPRSAQNWLDNMNSAEARLRADICTIGIETLSNPGVSQWQPTGWGRRTVNMEINENDQSAAFPNMPSGDLGYAAGATTKFYYHAGSRLWFEPPLFRLAETYLNLAEAYNEYGNSTEALKYLNAVHNRAGLPAITESEQNALRELIKREKAIEYFNENHRYYDVKHWKDPKIATEIIGGPKRELVFHVTSNSGEASVIKGYWDAVRYETYWHPRMFLEPFPQDEVNKGIIVQNPGY